MINKITLLVGSPGAGKSTLGNRMVELSNGKALFLDDISTLVKDNAPQFILNQAKLNGKSHVIIADVNFCFQSVLSKALAALELHFNLNVDVIYFENNLEKCLKNIELRMAEGDDRKVLYMSGCIAQAYVVPPNIPAISIYEKL